MTDKLHTMIQCERCKGKGELIQWEDKEIRTTIQCPNCKGKGTLICDE